MMNTKPKLESEKYKTFKIANTYSKTMLFNVFNQKSDNSINEFVLFVAYFNSIPNVIENVEIDCQKAIHWFNENYHSKIKNVFYNKQYYTSTKQPEIYEVLYIVDEDMIVKFHVGSSKFQLLFSKTKEIIINSLLNSMNQFKRKRKKKRVLPEITLLVNGIRGIETKTLNITKPKFQIEDNYNEDFKEIHQHIYKRLSQKNDKGIVLLHGKPGTGKTSYIRYLICCLRKEIIFLPPNMAGSITSPNLVSILTENPNSIFVIEDAENIVIDREKDNNSSVSALLNLSDGLLADCLNIQIICSFNTDISKIDSALMRKGRLIAKYEFKALEKEKSQKLSNKLGFDTIITEPMTLSSIYNQKDIDFLAENQQTIGFKLQKK